MKTNRIIHGDCIAQLKKLADQSVDLVFADPPYGKGLAKKALAALLAGDWLSADALLIVEEDKRSGFVAPDGYKEIDRRVKGDTELIFLALV